MHSLALATPVAQLGPLSPLMDSELGRLLLAIMVLAVIVFVGRFVLALAWRLLLIAGVVVAALYVLSLFGL